MSRKCDMCVYKAPEGCIAWDCNYIDRIEAIVAYKSYKKSWIPVTEQVPEPEGDRVLVSYVLNENFVDFPIIGIGGYCPDGWHVEVDTGTEPRVTAWMPLPKAYEEV